MRRESAWRSVVRSRWLVLLVVLSATGATAALSVTQAPVYVATATLVVNQPESSGASFDVVQANQAYARTLARLIGSRNVAADVARELGTGESAGDLLDRMSFATVTETQLIEVRAEDGDAEQAARLANAYAEGFVDYVQTAIPNAAPSSGVSVADPASVPPAPDRPKPTLYTLVALVLSTALGLALALVRARLDTRLRDPDQLEAVLGIPVLGTLPRIRRKEVAERLFEEGVRLMATSVAHAGTGPVRSIAVTSAKEGEGKSTVVAELGLALGTLSLVDDAVLLVDADLRRPALHRRLYMDPKTGSRAGTSTYLRGDTSFEASVVTTELSSLRLLPAGPLPQHPSALLGLPSSREALTSLVDRADVVVIDTPPVSVGADASLVAQDADCVLLVVDLGRSKLPDLVAAVDQLTKVGRRPLGLVVNRGEARDRIASYEAYAPKKKRFGRGGTPQRFEALTGGDDAVEPRHATPPAAPAAPAEERAPASGPAS
ncbi:MAG TPA: polysaccharide biosynthesis tyrosine autokinase [Mycobacteriales bacterium]|nr:polysaccharide biosynthesis tyrosine autokinase [Mycobacteriales bacterium]